MVLPLRRWVLRSVLVSSTGHLVPGSCAAPAQNLTLRSLFAAPGSKPNFTQPPPDIAGFAASAPAHTDTHACTRAHGTAPRAAAAPSSNAFLRNFLLAPPAALIGISKRPSAEAALLRQGRSDASASGQISLRALCTHTEPVASPVPSWISGATAPPDTSEVKLIKSSRSVAALEAAVEELGGKLQPDAIGAALRKLHVVLTVRWRGSMRAAGCVALNRHRARAAVN